MTKVRTDPPGVLQTPENEARAFRGHMGVEATRIIDRALAASPASERRIAAGLAYTSSHLRHLRGDVDEDEAPKHMQFRDVLALSTLAPDAFRFILNEMAERAGLAVVERVDGGKTSSLLGQLAIALKEDGEANAALLAKIGTSCPETRRAAIREGREALSARQALLRALEEEEAEHRAAIAPRAYAGAS